MITNTNAGVPYYVCSILGPNTLFYLLRPLQYVHEALIEILQYIDWY